jgi:hypothetical protein
MLALKLQIEEDDRFSPVIEKFDCLITHLKTKTTNNMTSSELERFLKEQFQNIARESLQAKLNMIGRLEAETDVKGCDGVSRPQKKLRERTIGTIFGDVTYERWGYSAAKCNSLFPADGHLNLPPEKYTLEVRRLVSEDVTRSSYDETLEFLSRRTAATVPKRQGIELANSGAEDFVDFYTAQANIRENSAVTSQANTIKEDSSLLVLTTDGKGIVMRSDGLREATRKAAEKEQHKLQKRLTPGEKKDRKRMTQVASVYTIPPYIRTAEEIAGCASVVEDKEQKHPRPENKRVWASVERGPDQVINEIFKEAQSQDPQHKKKWIGLVDGNLKQLRLLKEQATAFDVTLTIIIDFIHVLEYLWKASHVFYKEGDTACEQFVSERLLRILRGQSSQVAKGMRKMATDRKLPDAKRKAVDICASYLLKYKEYLRYDKYLAEGLPIATGVIEGACRYLVKDRMDITGARWGLSGAEAVLRLRSLRVSGDFDVYWDWHEKMAQERNHSSKYENGLPPLRDNDGKDGNKGRGHLRLVKG